MTASLVVAETPRRDFVPCLCYLAWVIPTTTMTCRPLALGASPEPLAWGTMLRLGRQLLYPTGVGLRRTRSC